MKGRWSSAKPSCINIFQKRQSLSPGLNQQRLPLSKLIILWYYQSRVQVCHNMSTQNNASHWKYIITLKLECKYIVSRWAYLEKWTLTCHFVLHHANNLHCSKKRELTEFRVTETAGINAISGPSNRTRTSSNKISGCHLKFRDEFTTEKYKDLNVSSSSTLDMINQGWQNAHN